jgi:hypothetical protein
MAKKPLRSQLNQIRAWVRQGRTDAWIAHQLDVPASELREFRRRHELAPEGETGDLELRDEIEAEIEATLSEEEAEEEEGPEAEEGERLEAEEQEGLEAEEEEGLEAAEADAGEREERNGEREERNGEEAPAGRRRRRRRRRRGGGRSRAAIQATFDHGDDEGYGLWLDPAVQDDPVYAEHWAGHRPVEVTIEADRIVIRRA